MNGPDDEWDNYEFPGFFPGAEDYAPLRLPIGIDRASRRVLALTGEPVAPLPSRVRPMLLGLAKTFEPSGRIVWHGQPTVLFRVQGLLAWGASFETFLRYVRVGQRLQAMASTEPFPAWFFASGLSFRELIDSAVNADGSPRHFAGPRAAVPETFWCWLQQAPKVDPRQLLSFDSISPGDALSITTSGHLERLCAWGVGAE